MSVRGYESGIVCGIESGGKWDGRVISNYQDHEPTNFICPSLVVPDAELLAERCGPFGVSNARGAGFTIAAIGAHCTLQ